jgi:hypothetical protein
MFNAQTIIKNVMSHISQKRRYASDLQEDNTPVENEKEVNSEKIKEKKQVGETKS